jgi:tetratricopeptide (TPR) repeat protein
MIVAAAALCAGLALGAASASARPVGSTASPGGAAAGATRATDATYNQLLRSAARQAAQGQHAMALATYQRLLVSYPDDATATRGCADVLVALHRREEAETLLQKYLDRKGYEEGIRRSLAEIHRADGRFQLYLDDVLAVLSSAPPDPGHPLPLAWALQAFEELAGEPATAGKVEPEIRKLVAARKDRPELRILLSDALLRKGEGDAALAEVTEADRASNSKGKLLVQYGEELYGAGRAALAESALEKAAGLAGSPADRTMAWSRMAEIAGEAGHPQSAARALQAVADLNPGSPARVEALLALADVKRSRLHDCAGALAAYEAVAGDPLLGPRRGLVQLRVAECRLRMNQLDEASKALAQIKPADTDTETQAEGAFLAAELKFYAGDFNAAQPLYQGVAEGFTRTRKANDAVGRYLQIARAQDQKDLEALKTYARMEQFSRLEDTTAVIQAARQLSAQFPASDLAAEGLVREAEMIRAPLRAEEAIGLCQKAAVEHPKARAAAYALALIGDICLRELNDHPRALATYEKLLDLYPDNLLAGEARRTVERLRRERGES